LIGDDLRYFLAIAHRLSRDHPPKIAHSAFEQNAILLAVASSDFAAAIEPEG
jgi:hypothetical protein